MSFFADLKRRNVFRVAAAYLVVAWLVIQVVETVFPAFGIGDAAIRLVVIVLAILFIPALIFSWAFEITPQGLKREVHVDREHSIARFTGKKLDHIIMLLLALALGYFALDKFVIDPVRDATDREVTADQARAEALVEAYAQNSIAVLPFADMSPDKDQQYLSDGISDELIKLLSRIPNLAVISRNSTFIFRGTEVSIPNIAEQLSVDYVLRGSISEVEDDLSVSVQLVDGRSESNVWSNDYERSMSGIFDIQDEVALAVVESLKITILGESPKSWQIDPEEYRKFLFGDFLLDQQNPANLQQAREIFESVTKSEPDYGPAWERLGYVYLMQGDRGLIDHDAGVQQARLAANVALRIDPRLAGAHILIGSIYRRFDWDWKNARDSFLTASKLDPNNAKAWVSAAKMELTLGHLENAVELNKKGVKLDPLSLSALQNLGIKQLWASQYEEAEKSFEELLSREPQYATANDLLAITYLFQDRYDEALAVAELESYPALRLQGLALAHWAKGNKIGADRHLAELINQHGDVWMYNIAETLAYMGNVDEAFGWLRKAIDGRDSGMTMMKADPLLTSMRQDPRWYDLLDELKLQ